MRKIYDSPEDYYRDRRVTIRLLVALVATALCLAIVFLVAGCGSDSSPSAPPAQSHTHDEDYSGTPGPADADQPAGVLTTALGTMFSWEPVTDTSPTDALRRAQSQLSGAALASARSTADVVKGSADWQAWRTSGDLITARVDDARAVITDPTHAVGNATVTQTLLHLDGGSTPYRKFTATAQLVRTRAGWTVATYPQTTD